MINQKWEIRSRYIAMGIALGAAFGILYHNIGLGIGLGVAFGIVFYNIKKNKKR